MGLPLSERMFTPLRVTRDYLGGQPAIARVAAEVREGAERALARGGAGRPVAILVGGPGAVWPFIPDAVASFGPVWQSGEPEADLAAGAAWWVNLRPAFGPSPAFQLTDPVDRGILPAREELPAYAERPTLLDIPDLVSPDADEIPPWERDVEEIPPWERDA